LSLLHAGNDLHVRRNKTPERLSYIMITTISLSFIRRSAADLIKTFSATWLPSLFVNQRSFDGFIKFVIGCLKSHSNSVMCFYLLFTLLTVFTFVHSITQAIKNLRISSDREEFGKLKVVYMKLTILTTVFNMMFSRWLMILEVMIIIAIVVHLFLSIVIGQLRVLILAMFGILIIVFLFSSCGDVNELATKTLNAWKLLLYQREFRKFHRSCRPWRISLGGFYFVDKALVLTILSIISQQTWNLILTHQSN
ncbi:unnamed protein product, partial [Allacma fusca]